MARLPEFRHIASLNLPWFADNLSVKHTRLNHLSFPSIELQDCTSDLCGRHYHNTQYTSGYCSGHQHWDAPTIALANTVDANTASSVRDPTTNIEVSGVNYLPLFSSLWMHRDHEVPVDRGLSSQQPINLDEVPPGPSLSSSSSLSSSPFIFTSPNPTSSALSSLSSMSPSSFSPSPSSSYNINLVSFLCMILPSGKIFCFILWAHVTLLILGPLYCHRAYTCCCLWVQFFVHMISPPGDFSYAHHCLWAEFFMHQTSM